MISHDRICIASDCNDRVHARGLCNTHYRRFLKYGAPLSERKRRPRRREMADWFMENQGFSGDECLPWPFGQRSDGYGAGYLGEAAGPASRIMCSLAHGLPPSEKHEAAHSCGNGHLGCVNPKHLRWDTHKGNHSDRKKHGTNLSGERHNMAKLTRDQAMAIRDYSGIMSNNELGEVYGVSPDNIRSIRKGKTWKCLDDEIGQKVHNSRHPITLPEPAI